MSTVAWARRHAGRLALVSFVLACAFLVQGTGWNQLSHYALVRALAEGTATIDRYRGETGDVSYFEGHYYSNKAPGLAFVTLPAYLALDSTGAGTMMARLPEASTGGVGMLWALGLVGVVFPAALLLLLVQRTTNLLASGFGAAAALTMGLGTLVLPFATLFFSHVLAAALGFAAFVLAWRERERDPRAALLVAAGALAGLAITTEYPLAIVAVAVGLYVLARPRRAGRALAYGSGVAVGVLPLLLYNWWAFGSPLHLSYVNVVIEPGRTGHDVIGAHATGFFGVGMPSFRAAAALLVSSVGLLTLTPVVAAGFLGTCLLFRQGRRAEAATIAGVAIAFFVYNSAYFLPLGGSSPGPRFLLPVLPFLAVSVALAYRAFPTTTLALFGVSAASMLVITATGPLRAPDGRWLERLGSGDFVATVLSGLGAGRGWIAVSPFFVAVACACIFASLAMPRLPVRADEIPVAAAALLCWALVSNAGTQLLEVDVHSPISDAVTTSEAGAVSLLVAAAVAAVALVHRHGRKGLVALLPLAVIALPGFVHVTAISLASALVLSAAALSVWPSRRRALRELKSLRRPTTRPERLGQKQGRERSEHQDEADDDARRRRREVELKGKGGHPVDRAEAGESEGGGPDDEGYSAPLA